MEDWSKLLVSYLISYPIPQAMSFPPLTDSFWAFQTCVIRSSLWIWFWLVDSDWYRWCLTMPGWFHGHAPHLDNSTTIYSLPITLILKYVHGIWILPQPHPNSYWCNWSHALQWNCRNHSIIWRQPEYKIEYSFEIIKGIYFHFNQSYTQWCTSRETMMRKGNTPEY